MGRLERRRDGVRVTLSAEHVVGRLPLCHLSLDASFISTAHALLRWNGEFWELRDLGSRNGTYLDQQRVAMGSTVRVSAGTDIVFGEPSETWRLVDDRAPSPAAVPVDGGAPILMVSGTISVPSAGEPLATIYAEDAGWILEMDDLRAPIQPGEVFSVAERAWRFDCPSGAAQTRSSEQGSKKLDDVVLMFGVSRNEEHVSLKVRTGYGEKDLGERGGFYLALVLCEHRLKERDRGVSEPGWLEVEQLLKMIPDYTSPAHVNVEICRLRQLFHDAGFQDAPGIVERRRGRLRFGTDRAEIRRQPPPPGPVS
jgi:hypothetical protein